MELSKPKPLMEPLQDITDNIKKVMKLLQTQLPVFLLGLEAFFTELNLIIFQNLKNSVIALKHQLLNVSKTVR